jgi:hypothetical protein
VARSRNPELEAEATASGVRVAWHLQDLSQPGPSAGWLASVLDAVEEAPASITLILNAGVVEPIGPITQLHDSTLVPHLQTNLVTPMTMTGAFIEHTVRFDCPRKVLAISSGGAQPRTGVVRLLRRQGRPGHVHPLGEHRVRERARAAHLARRGAGAGRGGYRNAGNHPRRGFRPGAALPRPQGQRTARLADDTARRIVAYLARPDFGTTELDDIRKY